MMKNYCLEACVDSVQSAINAKKGGANRLELCGNLILGGTTPSIGLFEEVKKQTNMEMRVLIRPRFGDFCYTEEEFQVILRDIDRFVALGADGIVTGMLKEDGNLHIERMKEVMEHAKGCKVTLHRAFDVCCDPNKTLEQAKELGIHTILTSGQADCCLEGTELIKQLIKKAENQIEILIGSGVNKKVIEVVYEKTEGTSYHMSGKEVLQSQMIYRKEGVNMGLSSFSEFEIWQTKEEKIREAVFVLKRLIG